MIREGDDTMNEPRRSDRSARLCIALGVAAVLLALTAPAAGATATEGGDLDREAVEKRFSKELGYWNVQLVLTSSFAAVPMTIRQISWAAGRSCSPSKVRCGTGYDTLGDMIWIPFSMINLGLGVPSVLGAKLTLMTLRRQLDEATSAGVLARQWRREGNRWGLASGLTGVGAGAGLLMAAIGARADTSTFAEIGLVMAMACGTTALVLLHIALPHAVMAEEVERTAGQGKHAARRPRGARIVAISPLGITGVW
jgi:hypothetical protein